MSRRCCNHIIEVLEKLSKTRSIRICVADDSEVGKCKLYNKRCHHARNGAPDLLLTSSKSGKRLAILIELKTHVTRKDVINLRSPITKTLESVSNYAGGISNYKVIIAVNEPTVKKRMESVMESHEDLRKYKNKVKILLLRELVNEVKRILIYV